MSGVFSKKGFSFVQIMMAVAVLAMALTSIFTMNINNSRKLKENRLYLKGLICAREVFEQISEPDWFSKYIDQEVIISKEQKNEVKLNSDFLDEHSGKIRVNIKKNDENVVYVYLELKYINAHKRETTLTLRKGVFFDVY